FSASGFGRACARPSERPRSDLVVPWSAQRAWRPRTVDSRFAAAHSPVPASTARARTPPHGVLPGGAPWIRRAIADGMVYATGGCPAPLPTLARRYVGFAPIPHLAWAPRGVRRRGAPWTIR